MINYTINKKNEKENEQFCSEISKIKKVKGIFFYFYTPSHGIDDLYLGLDERKNIIVETMILLAVAKKKYQNIKKLNKKTVIRILKRKPKI
mgnify:CR=1 FL=1